MLKANAKNNLKRYYWWAFLVCFIVSAVSGGFSGTTSSFRTSSDSSTSSSDTSGSSTIETPYDLGYVEGYDYGYESYENGYKYSEDAIKSQQTDDNKDYIEGMLDGYHAGYYDAFNGNEKKAVPPSSAEEKTDPFKDVKDWESFKNALYDFVKDDMGLSMTQSEFYTILGIAAVVMIIAMIIGLLFSVFVSYPLNVGAMRFFQTARIGNVAFSSLGYSFGKGRYMKTVKTMFITALYEFLWGLLFFIPGIIKSYSYALVPYIMAENPDIPTNKAITISRKTMKGEKWHYFVLNLSFILWYLLAIITCGIGIMFLLPYVTATQNEFYALMRQKALSFGYATPEELPGFPAAPPPQMNQYYYNNNNGNGGYGNYNNSNPYEYQQNEINQSGDSQDNPYYSDDLNEDK